MPRNAIPLVLLFGGLTACICLAIADHEMAFAVSSVVALIGWQRLEAS